MPVSWEGRDYWHSQSYESNSGFRIPTVEARDKTAAGPLEYNALYTTQSLLHPDSPNASSDTGQEFILQWSSVKLNQAQHI